MIQTVEHSTMKEQTEAGYVYLVTHSNAPGLHKIGLTRHPRKRIEQLGGNKLNVVAMIRTSEPERIEKALHRNLKSARVPQSEWFNLNEDQLAAVKRALTKAHQADDFVVLPDVEPQTCTQQNTDELNSLKTEFENYRKTASKTVLYYKTGLHCAFKHYWDVYDPHKVRPTEESPLMKELDGLVAPSQIIGW